MAGSFALSPSRAGIGPRAVTLTSLLLLQVALALIFVGGKEALAQVPPLTFEATRRLAAAAILIAFVALHEGPASLRPRRADLVDAVVPGLLGFGFGRACVMIGLSLAAPTNVALIDAAAPAVALLIAAVLAVERPSRLALVGSSFALAGVVAFVVAGGALSGATGGELIVLGSPIAWGAIYVWVASRPTTTSLLRRTAWFSLAGAIALTVPAFVTTTPEDVAALVAPSVLPVLLLAIGVGVVENGLTFRAVAVIGAVSTAEFEYLVPVLAAAAGLVLLGTPLLPLQVAAGVIILGGLAISGRARTPTTEPLPGRPCCVA